MFLNSFDSANHASFPEFPKNMRDDCTPARIRRRIPCCELICTDRTGCHHRVHVTVEWHRNPCARISTRDEQPAAWAGGSEQGAL